MNTIFQSSFYELEKDNLFVAQRLFRKNVMKIRNHFTLNNLGVFYLSEGIQLKDGRSKNANKLAFHYLLESSMLSETYKNSMALGYAQYSLNDFPMASFCFKKALKANKTYVCYFDLGVSLLKQNQYQEASNFLKYALDTCKNDNWKEIYTAYLYALQFFDKKQCSFLLQKLIDKDITFIEMDVFILSYFCDAFEMANRICDSMFKAWRVDLPVMAMVLNSLLLCKNNKKAQYYLDMQISKLKGFDYNLNREIKKTEALFNNTDYRNDIINSFEYNIPLLKENWYFKSS